MSRVAKGKLVSMAVNAIVVDPELQNRVNGTDVNHVENLAEGYGRGDKIPRLTVMKVSDRENRPFLIGGHNRLAGAKAAGLAEVPANVLTGTWEDAVALALAENDEHNALPLTPADKRRKVMMALAQWPRKSNGFIAEKARVDEKLVRRVKQEQNFVADGPTEGRDGKSRKAKVATVPAWRKVALDDFLPLDSPFRDKVVKAGATNAGQLDDAVRSGQFGFTDQEREFLAKELDVLKNPGAEDEDEAPSAKPAGNKAGTGGGAKFLPAMLTEPFGAAVRSVDLLVKTYPALGKSENVRALNRLFAEAAKAVKAVEREANEAAKTNP